MLIERYCPLLPPPRFTCATTATPSTMSTNVPRNSASVARFSVIMNGPLRIQELVPPPIALARVDEAVVKTVGARAPELDALGNNPIAAPVRRPRHGRARIAGVHVAIAPLERLAVL